VKENTRQSGQGDGPEIIILDPNDAEGAYRQMMEQYRKHQDKSDDSRD
jgi:hypothetical protein